MKKLISVILVCLCIFSVASIGVFADEVWDEISSEFDDNNLYCVAYHKETLAAVKMMYVPNPTTNFNKPGYLTITNDTPLAIDHDFICWKDKNGRFYYPGDKIYVNGTVDLYAVWEEKTDNDNHVFRTIKCALLSLQRILQRVFGVFKDFEQYDAEIRETLA